MQNVQKRIIMSLHFIRCHTNSCVFEYLNGMILQTFLVQN